MKWEGVFPAMTTPFGPDLAIDHGFLADHARWLVENGSRGLVVLGSLGEGATLSTPEKQAIVETVVKSVGDRVPVVAGISALGTSEAADLARMARDSGCRGLMVLPPYVYVGDWREIVHEVEAELVEERRIDGIHRAAENEGIAVRWSPHRRLGREVAACTRPVLHDDRLMKLLRHPFGNDACNDIEIATRRKANQQTHGTTWVTLRPRQVGNRRKRGDTCRKAQELPAR